MKSAKKKKTQSQSKVAGGYMHNKFHTVNAVSRTYRSFNGNKCWQAEKEQLAN